SKKEAKKLAVKDTAEEIDRLLQGGQKAEIKIGNDTLTGKDIAVRVRKHDQADSIREALQERGIKSVQYSDRSVFKSEEAEQLTYILEAIITPTNERLIKTALATPMVGYNPEKLLQIEDHPKKWPNLLEKFSDWNKLWQQKGFAAMFGAFMQKMNVREQLIQR